MSKKKGILATLPTILLPLILLTVGAIIAAEAPKETLIKNEGYKSDKKGPVKLSHEKHVKEYGAACDSCHHVYEDGKNVWKEEDPVQKCSECHDPNKNKGNAKRLQLAYHKNCKDCHKEYTEKHPDAKAPYKSCNDCHQKK